ncbi:uroporphyrinogen-III synthase [Roseovarius sp. SCSIO 43702]|uniref:uroporphyrinogen-III synthase n=1 Tax=Roseovarius sp. SCSIO 43702 TaxID=2823043 RepID=UPI001C73D151|nr:uroporphyrinogen-III synthase [Roseovarius sp. SCSIO 43702]QYX57388.1 uroporphyrinogen-III synthase [Roseovarius sp. SCSIO 43702]
MSPTLLITRPEEDALRFADQARGVLGCAAPVVISPLLAIEPCAAPDPGDAATLILTSRHALHAAPPGMSAVVVGPRLADLAREAGLEVRLMAPDAATLLPRLLADPPPGPLLHLRGEHVAAHVARHLAEAGIPCAEAVVYTQPAQPLTAEARALLARSGPVVVPLFSPRTGRLFFAQGPHATPLVVVALSDAVAATCPETQNATMIVAARPDAAALLAELPRAWDVAKRVEGDMPPG